MTVYTILCIIITLTALFSYFIARFTKLPTTIGVMMATLLVSVMAFILNESFVPFTTDSLKGAIASLDFHDLLLNRMLGFLLFAGALHINLNDLKKEALPVAALASAGTLISTFVVGGLMFFIFTLFSLNVPFVYCLLFGTLISPTDPIAVLGILKEAKIARSLEMKISGESLFNDGVAIVLFTLLYEVAQMGTDHLTVSNVLLLFLQEAGGGLAFGFMLGYAGYFLNRSINNYGVEVMITIAIVMGGYELANYLHISGALAMVVAGLYTGNQAKTEAMSDTSRDYLGKFWDLLDQILNAILFMLIGLEMLIIPVSISIIGFGLIAILVVLIARYISVAISVFTFKKIIQFEKNSVRILTWGGVRGGISVALALSLANNMYKNQFVAITYIIVVFSIVVQGLTIGKVAKKLSA